MVHWTSLFSFTVLCRHFRECQSWSVAVQTAEKHDSWLQYTFSNLNRLAVMFWIIYQKTDFLCTNKVLENTYHCFTIQPHYSVLQKSLKNYSCARQYGCSYQLLQSDSPDTDMHSQFPWIPIWDFLVPYTLGRDSFIFVSESLVLHWVFHSAIHNLMFFSRWEIASKEFVKHSDFISKYDCICSLTQQK